MHNLMMCQICDDYKKYQSSLNNLRRIVSNLKWLKISNRVNKDNQYYKILHSFKLGQNHIHFLCGTCMKANTSELNSLENELNDILTTIVLDDNLNEETIHKVLLNLRGYYPLKYRTFERLTKSRN